MYKLAIVSKYNLEAGYIKKLTKAKLKPNFTFWWKVFKKV